MVQKLSSPQAITKFEKYESQFDLEDKGYQFSNLFQALNIFNKNYEVYKGQTDIEV